MKVLFTLLITFSFTLFLSSQILTPEAKLIFKDVATKISIADKNAIAVQSGFKLLKNKIWSADDFNFSQVTAMAADLNSDGVEEIFISASSSEYFGNTGEGFTLFMKDKNGKYHTLFVLETGIPSVVKSKTKGFFDIVVGGPGFEFPLYAWNGTQYKFLKSISDSELTRALEANVTQTPAPNPVVVKDEALSADAADFFKDTKSKLSNAQKNKITQLSGYVANSNKKNKKVSPLPVDLNSDGVEEVFIWTKTTLLGIPSNEYLYFVPDKKLGYASAIGTLPQTLKIVINDKKEGYPFIITGKMGADRLVWQWKNNAYESYMNVLAKDSYLLKLKSIEDASLEYMGKL